MNPALDTLALIDGFQRDELQARNRSPHTQAAYRRDVTQFCNYLTGSWGEAIPCDVGPDGMGEVDWRNIGGDELRGFLSYLYESGATRTSVHRKVSALRTFFKYLRRCGHIDKIPAVDLRARSVGRRQPRVLFYDEVEQLLSEDGDPTPLLVRNLAIIETLYGTGMRVGTLVRIDIADLDFNPPRVRVTAKGNKQQELPLGEQAVAALRRYLELRTSFYETRRRAQDVVDDQALFLNRYGGRISDQAVRAVVRKMTLGRGLGRVTPHTFRHTAATHLLEAGADVRAIQELLGHASLSTTGRYTQMTVDLVRATYASAHPGARRKPER